MAKAYRRDAFHTPLRLPASFDVIPSAVSRGLHSFNINGPLVGGTVALNRNINYSKGLSGGRHIY